MPGRLLEDGLLVVSGTTATILGVDIAFVAMLYNASFILTAVLDTLALAVVFVSYMLMVSVAEGRRAR